MALPRKSGLSSFDQLEHTFKHHQLSIYEDMKTLIRLTPQAWVGEDSGEHWYLFEGCGNQIFKLMRKAFLVSPRIPITQLAECLLNGLQGCPPSDRPTYTAIELYLRESGHLVVDSDGASYLNHANTKNKNLDIDYLTPLERDLISLLSQHSPLDAPAIRKQLLDYGYCSSSINAALYRGTLVVIDRSHGKRHSLYRLIGSAHHTSNSIQSNTSCGDRKIDHQTV